MADHTHNADCTGIENPDIHDGILWWICSDGTARPRFAPGCPHHQPGVTHANAYNRGRNDERGERTSRITEALQVVNAVFSGELP